MKKTILLLVALSLVSLAALAWVKFGTRPHTPATVFLTTGECKQLGGDATSDNRCGEGKHMCTTQTVSPVTKEVTTHQLCCTD